MSSKWFGLRNAGLRDIRTRFARAWQEQVLWLREAFVNFINVVRAAFLWADPKSIKRHWRLDWILTLLGVTCVKGVCKYIGEIDPRSQKRICTLMTWLKPSFHVFRFVLVMVEIEWPLTSLFMHSRNTGWPLTDTSRRDPRTTRCQFHQHFMHMFFVQCLFSSFSLVTCK